MMAKIFASQTKININKSKYGVQVPTEHAQDLELDNHNGDNFSRCGEKGYGEIKLSGPLRRLRGGQKIPRDIK